MRGERGVRFGVQLVEVEQDETGVTATLEDRSTGARPRLRAA